MITANAVPAGWPRRAARLVLAAVLLAGCAARAPVPEPAAEDAGGIPWASYRAEAGADAELWRLQPEASRLWVFVSRAGALARLGHDHLIAARGLDGVLVVPGQAWQEARGELHLPVRRLAVDPPAARAGLEPGLGATPPEADIAATRDNLVGAELLDGARHPRLRVFLRGLSGTPARPVARFEAEVRGTRHALALPVRLERAAGRLTVSGLAAIEHGALGLEPFTALAGALRVGDPLVVDFRLVYRPLPGNGSAGAVR